MTPDAPSWIHDLYTPELAALFLARPPELAAREAARVAALLRLPPEGGRVFDQCCGTGSLALPLARLGHEVEGVDLIGDYIRAARAGAAAEGLRARFEEGDARAHRAATCHGALNWWTSFGHCGDEGDLNMLRRAHESLLPGGRLALDYMNLPQVLAEFMPAHALRATYEGAPLTLLRETRLDLEGGWMLKTWTYITPGAPPRATESRLRMYTPWEVVSMMRAAGFERVRCYGGLGEEGDEGAPLTHQSRRLICVGERP